MYYIPPEHRQNRKELRETPIVDRVIELDPITGKALPTNNGRYWGASTTAVLLMIWLTF